MTSKDPLRSRIECSYRRSGRYFQGESHYSSSFRGSKISVVLALSANEDDNKEDKDESSVSNDAIVPTQEDSGCFDYDIVRRRGPQTDARRDFAAALKPHSQRGSRECARVLNLLALLARLPFTFPGALARRGARLLDTRAPTSFSLPKFPRVSIAQIRLFAKTGDSATRRL